MHKTYAEEALFFVLNANVFCSISVHKAAGPDNIPNWVLKGFAHILALPVSMLTNLSFKKEQLPLIWKCANIYPPPPLPKSSTVNDINTDLRPISLTPTISKIAEEYVVVNHVKPAVIKHIRPDQYGCIYPTIFNNPHFNQPYSPLVKSHRRHELRCASADYGL
jgi:hypothetical protein